MRPWRDSAVPGHDGPSTVLHRWDGRGYNRPPLCRNVALKTLKTALAEGALSGGLMCSSSDPRLVLLHLVQGSGRLDIHF